MSWEIFKNPIIPTWFAAIGAISAVVFAIFRDAIVKWYKKPVLEIECLNQSPYNQLLPMVHPTTGEKSTDAYFFRILVHNRGRSDATNVEVFIKKLYWWNGVKYQWLNSFLPMNLCWANRPSEDQKNSFMPKIPQDSYRYCDLGHIKKDVSIDRYLNKKDIRDFIFYHVENKTILHISKLVKASNFEYLLGPKQYCFEVQLTGDNCKTETYFIHINHSGDWHDSDHKMFKEGTRYIEFSKKKPDIHIPQKDKVNIWKKIVFWKRKKYN